MLQDSHLLIVGGTGRNVGKTEFICRLIAKIAVEQQIYALKVSAIYPDEEIFHGNHSPAEPAQFLFEETRPETHKDTSRMLRAGASRVFYLRSDDSGIETGFDLFRRRIEMPAAVICESNSLGAFIRPGLLVMIKNMARKIKPRAMERLRQADLIVTSDGCSGFAELDEIRYDALKGWYLDSAAPLS